MTPVAVDFETYYDKEYSLKKMMTEEYIQDPRFEIIMVSVKEQEEDPVWFSGTLAGTREWLAQFNLHKRPVIAHNMLFDGLILTSVLDIHPGLFIDTRFMSQYAVKPFTNSASLKAAMDYVSGGILEKGDTVYAMAGRSRASLGVAEMEEYAEYCLRDAEGAMLVYRSLRDKFTVDEFNIIDATCRMYLYPQLELDSRLLGEILAEARSAKDRLVATVCAKHGITLTDLRSNDKFANLLIKHGLSPPKKISPATNKTTWAFSKADAQFIRMVDEYDEHPVLGPLLQARLGSKSSIEETRADKLLAISLRTPKLRVPLVYYGAHTGRYGGTEGINLQNPPRVDKSRLRHAIRAPSGHVVLAADLKQIEARIVAWLAGESNLLDGFREGSDIYSEFATLAFGKETIRDRSPDDNFRRFVGKTCILGLGYGMGPEKLLNSLLIKGVDVQLGDTAAWVSTYRNTYTGIPQLWRALNDHITTMAVGDKSEMGCLTFERHAVVLPNAMRIVFPHLCPVMEEGRNGLSYQYRFGGPDQAPRYLWGGSLLENITQALARIVVMQNMVTIRKHTGRIPALQVHDELDYVVRTEELEQFSGVVRSVMGTPPKWAMSLPVEVDIHHGETFGDCK